MTFGTGGSGSFLQLISNETIMNNQRFLFFVILDPGQNSVDLAKAQPSLHW
jgi:hypothetical protein